MDLSDVTGHLPSAHFDAEKFVDANARLLDLRTGVLTAIEEGEYEAARELTGQLFHTLQVCLCVRVAPCVFRPQG